MDLMTRHTSRLWILLLIAAGGTLIFLAWLQYRWISQVSDAERDRLRSHLTADVRAIAEDLDTAINRVIRSLVSGPPELRGFEDRALAWYENGQDQKLVRAVYAVDGSKLLRYEAKAQHFVDAEWPAELETLRRRLPAALASRPPQVLVVDAAMPAMAMIRRRPNQAGPPPGAGDPREGRPGLGWPGMRGMGMGFGPPGGGPPPWMQQRMAEMLPNAWSIIEFDGAYLKSEFL